MKKKEEKLLALQITYLWSSGPIEPTPVTNETSRGHYLIVNRYSSMSLFKFHNLSVIVNCVTKSLIH